MSSCPIQNVHIPVLKSNLVLLILIIRHGFAQQNLKNSWSLFLSPYVFYHCSTTHGTDSTQLWFLGTDTGTQIIIPYTDIFSPFDVQIHFISDTHILFDYMYKGKWFIVSMWKYVCGRRIYVCNKRKDRYLIDWKGNSRYSRVEYMYVKVGLGDVDQNVLFFMPNCAQSYFFKTLPSSLLLFSKVAPALFSPLFGDACSSFKWAGDGEGCYVF